MVISLIIGGGIIGAFYGLGKNRWSNAEYIWEGIFAFLASIVITLMGAALLRVSKLQLKWRIKLVKALETKDFQTNKAGRFRAWAEKYVMFILPFITVLREGLEAVIFISGVSFASPASAFPLPVVAGIIAGCLVGVAIYKYALLESHS